MKKSLKYILTVLILVIAFHHTCSQVAGYRQPASEKAIPKIVLSSFSMKYPHVFLKGWYVTHLSYWQNDISSGWYSEWYGQRNIVVYTFDKPSYFEVEFINNPGELSRSIYNLYGYWYETRSRIKGLPIAIHESLKKSEYAGWKVSSLKERIESPSWPEDIYRFSVSKGLKYRIISMDINGKIIQARFLEE